MVKGLTSVSLNLQPTCWPKALKLLPEEYSAHGLTNVMSPVYKLARSSAGTFPVRRGTGGDDTCMSTSRPRRPFRRRRSCGEQHRNRPRPLRPRHLPPQHMPDLDIPRLAGPPPAAAIPAAAFKRADCVRVLRVWRTLPLDPYIALAATLGVAGSVYEPRPDEALRRVEADCDRIREVWNGAAPKAFRAPFCASHSRIRKPLPPTFQ
ncbi:hypothetical protein VTO73DRAFT_10691 [Trametes versicolor]